MNMLEIAKYLGILVALLSGVIGTVFDAREKNGRLNRWGRLLLACVVLGCLTSAIIEYLDDEQSNREKAGLREALSSMTSGIERNVNPVAPLAWGAKVRYDIDPGSSIETYINRLKRETPSLVDFDLTSTYKYRPAREDATEVLAWSILYHPHVHVAFLKADNYGKEKSNPIKSFQDAVLTLKGTAHADKDGTWLWDAIGIAPFTSKMKLSTQPGGQLGQVFLIQNSPDSYHVNSITSPIQLAGMVVAADTPPYLTLDELDLHFPTGSMTIPLKQVGLARDMRRWIAIVDPLKIEAIFGISQERVEKGYEEK